jgi:hypothetical protein
MAELITCKPRLRWWFRWVPFRRESLGVALSRNAVLEQGGHLCLGNKIGTSSCFACGFPYGRQYMFHSFASLKLFLSLAARHGPRVRAHVEARISQILDTAWTSCTLIVSSDRYDDATASALETSFRRIYCVRLLRARVNNCDRGHWKPNS